MVDTLSIALSGLMAQNRKLSATASNIANASTTGALPTAQAPASTVYKPLVVNYTTQSDGGVTANVKADEKGYSSIYSPFDSYANSAGLVAAPNIDLGQEIVGLIETKAIFKANVAVIKTQDKMLGELLDTLK